MAHGQLSFTFYPESDVIIWVRVGSWNCCSLMPALPLFLGSQLLAQHLSGSPFPASGSYYVVRHSDKQYGTQDALLS